MQLKFFRIFFLLIFLFLITTHATTLAQALTTPAFQTDFENTTKTDANHLNLSIENWFEFGDYDGSSNGDGARMWVETTKAHSGSKSIGLEVSNITKSRRAEFDLYPHSLVGDELTVSQWLYLPADYGLHAPGIDWNWHEFNVLYSEYVPGTDRYLRLLINQPDITKSVFNITLGGRQPPNNTQYESARLNNFALPRGRWFNVRSYLKRDPINGKAKVWIDDQLIFDVTGITTKGNQTDYHISPAKVYYETTDTTDHKMWVDDVSIFSGYVPPTPACPTDIDRSGSTDLKDYSMLVSNFLKTPLINPAADIDGDGKVDLRDYSLLVASFLKPCGQ